MPDPLIGALEHKIPGIHIKNFGILIFLFQNNFSKKYKIKIQKNLENHKNKKYFMFLIFHMHS